jgi:hypothetical protein
MQKIRAITAICTFCAAASFAGVVLASGWQHAAAPMGQFEGYFESEDETVRVDYGCTGFSSSVQFSAEGQHIAAGVSQIMVDGAEVASGNTVYHSMRNETVFTSDIRAEWGDPVKDAHNRLITSIAGGKEAVWITPDGTEFTISLRGSSAIRNCVLE